ncbi:MAG: hypothetical protein CME65_13900 [Halobacteriovoraceae bacterium]|nr:hypothetical protein [Halobacteriovoraceae bacterium]
MLFKVLYCLCSLLLVQNLYAFPGLMNLLTSSPKTKLTSEEVEVIKDGFINKELYAAFKEEGLKPDEDPDYIPPTPIDPEKAAYGPHKMFDIFYVEVTNLYLNGMIPKGSFVQFETNYKNLILEAAVEEYNTTQVPLDADNDGVQDLDVNGNPLTTGPAPVTFWTQKYSVLLDDFFQSVLNTPNQVCVGQGVNATTKVCCEGLVKASYRGSKTGQGKLSGESCTKQEDCASGACVLRDPLGLNASNQSGISETGGYCVTWKACYPVNQVGESCDPVNSPLCDRSTCTKMNADSTGLNMCQAEGQACSGATAAGNAECCSGRCAANTKTCVENYECLNCVKSGAKPKNGESCCPGYYLDSSSGKCKTNLQPLMPILQSSLETIVNFIFPSAYAQENSPNITEAEQEYIQRETSRCNSEFSRDADKRQNCLDSLKTNATQNFEENDNFKLSLNEREELDRLRQVCTSTHSSGSEAHSECMEEKVNRAERCFRGRREGQQNVDCSQIDFTFTESETEKNTMFGDVSDADLIRNKQAPEIDAKTYSNIDQCEFHSYNDNWKDASRVEKNAEVFLRAFEFTFSNKGTQDFWVDSNSNFQNIFTRANDVAKKFRENRGKMINRLAEVDRKMSCKCIAIYGPDKFDAKKQSFFNEQCEEEKALLSTNLNTDSGKDINSDGDTVVQTGTNLQNIQSDEETEEKKIEEMDKGAIGISHERLLIEWLGLRRDAQLERFVDNSELEASLNELSEYISAEDFEEVWIDEVSDDGNMIVTGQPPGDTRPLFNWGIKKLKGWVAIAIIILAVAVGAALGGFGIIAALGGALGGAAAGLAVGLALSFVIGAFGGKGSPSVHDIKYVDGKGWGLFHEWDGFTKYYIGPQYDNNSPNSESRCNIKGRAAACLKSGYLIKLENMKYLDNLNGMTHYIIDPKLPLFVDPDAFSLEKMPAHSKNWVQIINDTVEAGVADLKTRTPNSFKMLSGKDDACHKDKGSRGCYNPKSSSKSYGKRDILVESVEAGHFQPAKGGFSGPVEFTDALQDAIKQAAQKYALCYSLQPGGPQNPTGINLADNCGVEGMGENDMGFGNLFETRKEAEAFSEYALEFHYMYSSLSRDKEMAYPLLGADAYFSLVAYNMKLVGSIAAARTNRYAEAYDLYVADWEDRVGEYKSLGEGTSGLNSRNITYSDTLFEIIGEFQFNGLDNIPELDQKIANAQTKGSSLSSAELNAVNAVRNKAIRANKDLEKQKKFISDTKDITGQASLQGRQANQIARINQPLSSFGMNKLGGPFEMGTKKLNKELGKLNKSIKAFNRRNSFKPAQGGGSVASNPFTMPKYGVPSVSGSNSQTGSNAVSNDQGLSSYQARALVKEMERDESLKDIKDSDSLFTIVSKAYKRNYGRVLVRSKTGDFVPEPKDTKSNSLTDERKDALKTLLGE